MDNQMFGDEKHATQENMKSPEDRTATEIQRLKERVELLETKMVEMKDDLDVATGKAVRAFNSGLRAEEAITKRVIQ